MCVWFRWSCGCPSPRRCSRWTETSCRSWSSIWSQPTTLRSCPPLRNWLMRSSPPTLRSTRFMVRRQRLRQHVQSVFDLISSNNKWDFYCNFYVAPSRYDSECQEAERSIWKFSSLLFLPVLHSWKVLALWRCCPSLCSDIFTATGQT